MRVFRPTAVVGGDLRQAQIAHLLQQNHTAVSCFFLEDGPVADKTLLNPSLTALSQYPIVILPMPLSTDDQHLHAPFSKQKVTLQQVFSAISPTAQVFAGSVSPAVRALADNMGLSLSDYLSRPELAIHNAAATAEAAIAIAIQELPRTLLDAHILVTGYGRIAKALLQRLAPMGAHLACAARKWADLAEIHCRGVRPVPMEKLLTVLSAQDLVLNTVPALLFDQQLLQQLSPNALLIDLASKPGGVDFSAAAKLERSVVWALSLPGRFSPVSAGEMILESIANCLAERGDER